MAGNAQKDRPFLAGWGYIQRRAMRSFVSASHPSYQGMMKQGVIYPTSIMDWDQEACENNPQIGHRGVCVQHSRSRYKSFKPPSLVCDKLGRFITKDGRLFFFFKFSKVDPKQQFPRGHCAVQDIVRIDRSGRNKALSSPHISYNRLCLGNKWLRYRALVGCLSQEKNGFAFFSVPIPCMMIKFTSKICEKLFSAEGGSCKTIDNGARRRIGGEQRDGRLDSIVKLGRSIRIRQ